jgi:dihydropteroate synthase
MGVVNVTPDSFSDGGLFLQAQRAIAHGEEMAARGAAILDVGGESTRPGAAPVGEQEELDRVLPVVEGLARNTDALISIDTTKAAVARAALDAGAHVINDVSALGFDPDMARVAAESGAPLVLMHIRGTPETMQRDVHYDDVVAEVLGFLDARVQRALDAGVARTQIALDPGFGFGKEVAHNFRLVRELHRLAERGLPILFGPSRKSSLGAVVGGKPPAERVWATAGAVACGVFAGAHMLRVHDVAQMADVVAVAQAVCGEIDL